MPSKQIIDLFKELVLIKGTSLQEHRVVTFMRHFISDMPLQIIEDDAGKKLGGTSGNLIVVPNHVDITKPLDVFMAHMDTVRDTSGIEVLEVDGRLQSDGTSQLGADNRAGMAVVLNLLADWKKWQESDRNYMAVFSIAEEIGLLGASKLDLGGFNVESVWVFDSSKRPGSYIQVCAGASLFTATFKGKAAHSAVNPEAGISAIKVAAEAVSRFQIGRIADMTTVNIGTIKGGYATNVVAPECEVHGEIRAISDERVLELLAETEVLFRETAEKYGAGLKFESEKEFAPYSHESNSKMVIRMEKALRDAGLEVNALRYTGGSDANVLNEHGYPAINIGIGAQNPHADDEYILIEDLISSAQIAKNLILNTK